MLAVRPGLRIPFALAQDTVQETGAMPFRMGGRAHRKAGVQRGGVVAHKQRALNVGLSGARDGVVSRTRPRAARRERGAAADGVRRVAQRQPHRLWQVLEKRRAAVCGPYCSFRKGVQSEPSATAMPCNASPRHRFRQDLKERNAAIRRLYPQL